MDPENFSIEILIIGMTQVVIKINGSVTSVKGLVT